MLALLAIAPLLGLSLLAFGRISGAQEANQNLSELQAATTELVETVELQAAIQGENFWLATTVNLDALGYPTAFVVLTLGIDPYAQLASLTERTDRLAAEADIEGLQAALAEARRQPTGRFGLTGPLDAIEEDIMQVAVADDVERVAALAAKQPDGSQLVFYARKLEASNNVRSSFSDLRAAFFANFDDLDTDTRRTTMLELSRRLVLYNREVEELGLLIPVEGALLEPFAAMIESEDRINILDSVELTLVDFGYVTTGNQAPAASLEATRPAVLNFASADLATGQHLVLVTEAASVLTTAVEIQRQQAHRSALIVIVASLAFAVVTIGAIVAATQWIVRPLSDLGRTASALTQGGTGSLRPASGPSEIRLIHDALAEAITNLERTEQQAIALADGALDDASLEQIVPGRFGATLNAAIEQLRRSISNQEQASDQLAYEAAHDGLTGLANRRAAIDFLTASLGNGSEQPATVFFIDLDHFKQVNDTMGHAAGDEVLCSVANALRSGSRATDMVGRIGGDEFLIVSRTPSTLSEAQAMGRRYLDAINQSLDPANGEIGASIGVAMGVPGDAVDSLLAEADVAMLEAKKRGRDAVRVFDSELRARTLDELSLSSNIRAGLAAGEFELHFQPIVDTISGTVLEYEALIRWDRPGVGRVPPDDYIPFAEQSDLVIDIDRWVLDSAAETLASDVLDGKGIAVNISGRHLANGDLFGDLTAVLARTGINPCDLTIEITESALLGDIDGAIETLRNVRATGVKVAIDDFGTGFTSLTHLRSLPADVLKIDQSFTSNLDNSDDANLVRLVIRTAHILRLDVVMEGVETEHQAKRVALLGADHMQGYYFARPMPLDQLVAATDDVGVTTHPTSSHR